VIAPRDTFGHCVPQRGPIRLLAAQAALGVLTRHALRLSAVACQHYRDHLANALLVHAQQLPLLAQLCIDLNQNPYPSCFVARGFCYPRCRHAYHHHQKWLRRQPPRVELALRYAFGWRALTSSLRDVPERILFRP
jgi:hypothetical protein